ncbi:MAG TPA: hypothetical protein VHS96_09965 [Bacteroidia bacterium]|nr:hypothetical protein [Bacteroidia bacterium]
MLGIALVMLLFAACKRDQQRSEFFGKIFKEGAGGTFRGVDIGMDLSEVQKREGTLPKHDDQWGQVYEYGLGGKSKYFLEYICRDPKSKTINSIVLNAFLEEKAEASDLFTEMEMYLRNRYGVADGTLGNLRWLDEEINLMVALRMLDDKKTISLSYGALQSF